MRTQSVQITGKLSYRADLIALWTEKPQTTIEQAYAATGAPIAVVKKVRRELVDAGVLKAGGCKW